MITFFGYYFGVLLERIADLFDNDDVDDHFWDFDEREEL